MVADRIVICVDRHEAHGAVADPDAVRVGADRSTRVSVLEQPCGPLGLAPA